MLSGGQTFYHLNVIVHVYKVTPDFVWGRLSRKLVDVMRPRWALKWRSFFSESISLCLPGTGWTHIFIKTSQSAMMSKKARTPSSRFRPTVLIGDCDLSFLSVCSVRRLKHVCPRLFRLLVCLFLGTVVTVKTLIITLLPPLLSFWEYRFLFSRFSAVLQSTEPFGHFSVISLSTMIWTNQIKLVCTCCGVFTLPGLNLWAYQLQNFYNWHHWSQLYEIWANVYHLCQTRNQSLLAGEAFVFLLLGQRVKQFS